MTKLLKKTGHGREGIALLMVIWVLTILTVIVLSFSYMARTETFSSMAFRDGIEKKFLAEAGIQRGIMEVFYRRANLNAPTEEGKEGAWNVDGTPYTVQTDKGSYVVRITDESGKLDINQIKDVNSDILRNLLVNMGVAKEDSDTIVDSLLDWKDPDDLRHMNGAENEYYQSLPNPYKAKNADLDTIEELLMVKGMTPDILDGTGGKKGLIDFITINAKTSRVNAAAAPKEVLMAFPGITAEIADQIVSMRAGTTADQAGIQGLLANVTPPLNAYIGVGGTGNTFTIESEGFTATGKKGFAIRATVVLDGTNKYHYVYYKSPAEIKTDTKDANTDTANSLP